VQLVRLLGAALAREEGGAGAEAAVVLLGAMCFGEARTYSYALQGRWAAAGPAAAEQPG
jgi:hypothetical protein